MNDMPTGGFHCAYCCPKKEADRANWKPSPEPPPSMADPALVEEPWRWTWARLLLLIVTVSVICLVLGIAVTQSM